jgi:D-amino-acid dehydrogenase
MATVDVVVLGAGIVGTSTALQLARRGLAVALIDRRNPGEATSFGNAGIIENKTIFPPVFPKNMRALLRVALKRAPEANYHFSCLPQIAPWLLAFRAASHPKRLEETARVMRPLFARAVHDHEVLLADAQASPLLRKNGWLKLYRTDQGFAGLARELELAREFGLPFRVLDTAGAQELEPNLAPVFRHAVFWDGTASVTNPLAVTKAYAARLTEIGGVFINAEARTLHRAGTNWRVDTTHGPLDARGAVVALGPFTPDVLDPLGLRLPLAVKRGYHRQFRAAGNAGLVRPVLDAEMGYCLAPMQDGIRLTTGVEFAPRDAAPTPVQLGRVMPAARNLFPLDQPIDTAAWMGCRPCFPDSRPVIGRAPGHPGLWLAYGHAHWGLTLGPTTGELLADMISGVPPFTDPAPYGAERFK